MEPGAGVGPVAVRGGHGHAERLGRFLDRETDKIAELDDLGFARVATQFFLIAVQDAVHEALGFLGRELLGDVDGLVDADDRRDVRAAHQLEDGDAQDGEVDARDAAEGPVLGVLADDDNAIHRMREGRIVIRIGNP